MDADRTSTAEGKALPGRLASLWERQAAQWPALAAGIAALRGARHRGLMVGESRIELQCNPGRLASTSAKVQPQALARRPCFLCAANRPAEQQAVTYRDDWLILCNPAPIFEPHFTIAHALHVPQHVGPALGPLLDLACELEGAFTVFYNGPGSGASAPDHLHLQATPVGAMPFELVLAEELAAGDRTAHPRGIEWLSTGPVRLGLTRPHLRPAVVLVGRAREELIRQMEQAVAILAGVAPATPEPRFNLYASYTDECWLIWLFPRGAHRPDCYGTGPDDYLISPGAIDLGGVLIVPRQGDFERLTAAKVESILQEVLLPPGAFDQFRQRLTAAVQAQGTGGVAGLESRGEANQ